MIMRRFFYIPSLLLSFLWVPMFLLGCTKEEAGPIGNNTKMAFRISTKALVGDTEEGVTISSLRVLIVNPNLENIIVENRLIDSQSGDYVFKLQQGEYKICVVANETAAMTASLATAGKLSDLNAIRVVTPTMESQLVLYQSVDIMLRPLASDSQQAEVSVNGGTTWVSPPIVNVELKRVAAKISLAIKKETTVPTDVFAIKKVELINIPTDSYLTSSIAYTGVLQTQLPFSGPWVSFSTNGDSQIVFSDYIVPEYILSTPASATNAAALVITADYTKLGGAAREVVYTVPVLGLNTLDYSLTRNCHYNITATITRSAELVTPIIVDYEVLKWQSAGDGSFEAGAVTFAGVWEDGTLMNNQVIEVSNNTSVTYEFTLSFPPGATWTAQLTNVRDFDFDLNNNGVRSGVTEEGIVKRIKVRPRTVVFTNNVTTEFYITVFNGIETVELDLTNSGTIGEGNRFIIKQNPN